MPKQRNATLQALVAKGNKYIAESPDAEAKGREMLFTFIQAMLMEANSYSGFNYLYWTSIGCTEWHEAGEPEGPAKDRFIYGPTGDKTRVRFY